MILRQRAVFFLLIISFMIFCGGRAFSQDVPFSLQVKLILKILSFDKNFTRFGDPVKIGVSSEKALVAFKAIQGKLTIKGKQFVVEKMSVVDDGAEYNVLFVDTNWKSNYKEAADVAVANQILMFCSEEGGVKEGAAFSFRLVDNKPKIIISIGSAKSQGSDFPAQFLKITERV